MSTTRKLWHRAGTVAVASSLTLLLGASNLSAAPKVVASINPVHSLVAGVMDGIGTPTLLVHGGASPHTYALQPSDARALQNADVILWVGEGMESFLAKPIDALGGKARVVELGEVSGVMLLDAREGGAWEDHEHEGTGGAEDAHRADGHHDHREAKHEDEHDEKSSHGRHESPGHADHGQDGKNMHMWLDPKNAQAMVNAIVHTLNEVDPDNGTAYRANGDRLLARLDEHANALTARLSPVKDRPYLVFHDAYHYFENRFDTNAVGSLTVEPDRQPGAKRIAELREKIEHNEAVCVFAEPQFQPAIVTSLIAGTGARAGVLDPLGADIRPGPDAYFRLLDSLADALTECLTPSS